MSGLTVYLWVQTFLDRKGQALGEPHMITHGTDLELLSRCVDNYNEKQRPYPCGTKGKARHAIHTVELGNVVYPEAENG